MPRRHREAIVEAALAAARDVDERAIEHRLAGLVHMQAAHSMVWIRRPDCEMPKISVFCGAGAPASGLLRK